MFSSKLEGSCSLMLALLKETNFFWFTVAFEADCRESSGL